MARTDRILLRDLAIFQLKLFLDGLKDIVLIPVSIVAALIDMVVPGDRRGRYLYAVMRMGEGYDRWLSLFSAAHRAQEAENGLLGSEPEGLDSMLSRIEALVMETEGAPVTADRAA